MKILRLFLIMCLLLSPAFAGAVDSVENPKKCSRCGMDRTAFAHSRMLVVYDEGTTVGVCSLYCAVNVLQQNPDKKVSSLMVADYSTKKLLDAGSAFWVVGGKKKGVMTALAKWAFAMKTDAQRFVKTNSGNVNSFEQAMHSATQEVMELAAEEKKVEQELLREQKR